MFNFWFLIERQTESFTVTKYFYGESSLRYNLKLFIKSIKFIILHFEGWKINKGKSEKEKLKYGNYFMSNKVNWQRALRAILSKQLKQHRKGLLTRFDQHFLKQLETTRRSISKFIIYLSGKLFNWKTLFSVWNFFVTLPPSKFYQWITAQRRWSSTNFIR